MSDDVKSKKKSVLAPRRVSMSTPWNRRLSIMGSDNRCDFDTPGEVNEFIRQRTRLHEAYIREEAKSKRLGLVLGFLLIVAAAAIVQFAPVGRENLSYWIGAALVIFAAGCCGFRRIWGKAPKVSFGADQDRRSVDSQ